MTDAIGTAPRQDRPHTVAEHTVAYPDLNTRDELSVVISGRRGVGRGVAGLWSGSALLGILHEEHGGIVLRLESHARGPLTVGALALERALAEARTVLDDVQAAPIDKLPVDERWITVPAEVGDVRVRMVWPPHTGPIPVILYMHRGGWVLGNAGTHDRLVRELAVGAGAAVAFVEYDRSPEARYPVAIEQGYATAQWLTREGALWGFDPSRMAVAGDSVGGNMTAALTLMARDRGDVRFVHQSLYYPVTDAAMDTGSYADPTSSSARSRTHHRCAPMTRSSPTCRRRS
jgi:acetyl esterase/lipase